MTAISPGSAELAKDAAVAPPRRRIRLGAIGDHAILITGSLFMLLPALLAFITSSHDAATIHRNGLEWTFGNDLE